MPDSTPSAHEKMLETIIARAWEDPEFKASFMADPRGVLKSEFGYEYPDSISLRVVEETAEERCIVLPFNQGTEAELSESELETVAGGVTGTSRCTAVTGSAIDPSISNTSPLSKLSSLSGLSSLSRVSSFSC